MKALIVAESDSVINSFSKHYKSLGYDIICYKWIMKALDNVEEIDPDLILLSAEDYPRHWKTFIQFINGLKQILPEIYLYSEKTLGENENRKAKYLGVKEILNNQFNNSTNENNSPVDETSLSQDVPELNEIPTVTNIETQQNKQTNSTNIYFVFTNPTNSVIITGTVVNYSADSFSFIPDNSEILHIINVDTEIPNCTLAKDDEIKSVKCKVVNISSDTFDFVVLS